MASDERLVFPSLLDGYVKGLGPKFTAETRAKLKAAGLDMDRLPPAINASAMIPLMHLIANGAFPMEPREEQLRLLGLSAIRGWQSGLLGSAAAAMIRVIGPVRALTRLDRAFSTTNNFSKAKTQLLGPKEAAQLLGVTEADVLAVLEKGELKGKKIGTSWRIPRAAITSYLAE